MAKRAKRKNYDNQDRDLQPSRKFYTTPGKKQVVGILVETEDAFRIEPTDPTDRKFYYVKKDSVSTSDIGKLVAAKILPSSTQPHVVDVKISEVFGDPDDARNLSRLAIAEYQIPYEFSDEALAEAAAAKDVTLDGRTDLRSIPLVTIDGADARDFDDAVFADYDPKINRYHLTVAIADVAHYVRPGSALDLAAYERGNSTYFPDRVLPMLPEALSNDLCSLMPNVDRACMAVHMTINGNGTLEDYKFERGVMRSRARLTYDQVQKARDGAVSDDLSPLMPQINSLYDAYYILKGARDRRRALAIDEQEAKVILGDEGGVDDILFHDRLTAHRVIEEFMILANVATATDLEDSSCVYRVHDKPDEEKLESLRAFLDVQNLDIDLPSELTPYSLSGILKQVAKTDSYDLVRDSILHALPQAVYSSDNIEHFGLDLKRYAHFTSPIRRYSDLLVHRSLISKHKFGDDGLTVFDIKGLQKAAEHISYTERQSEQAERATDARYKALYLKEHVGEDFDAKISGVMRSAAFVTLDKTASTGILPFACLVPLDRYQYDEKLRCIKGIERNKSFHLGDSVRVTLEGADPLSGKMSFGVKGWQNAQKPSKKFSLQKQKGMVLSRKG